MPTASQKQTAESIIEASDVLDGNGSVAVAGGDAGHLIVVPTEIPAGLSYFASAVLLAPLGT